jgi:ABC-type multidrug transport system fused ATPase/permease subunit
LFSASCIARQRLERDESVRIHARFWDRIISTPLPVADATDLADNAMRRAFRVERALQSALTLAAERRNCVAPAVVIAITALLIAPDLTSRLFFATHILAALGIAFLLENGQLAVRQRAALTRHDLSRLERRLAFAMPMLRQHGVSTGMIRELETRHIVVAGIKYGSSLLQSAADAAPFWLAVTSLATTLAIKPTSTAGMFSDLFLLLPAVSCAADAGRRVARLRVAGQDIEVLKPLGLEHPLHAAEDLPLESIESVRLEAIGFRYQLDAPAILANFSISLYRGEIIALTGASGSGKSTLLDILMGLAAPQLGRIVVNGVRRDWHALSSYRAHIAGILQDTPTGLSSISAFIGQNAPMARESDILQAAADAGLANAIAALPMGMQSLVAEGGFPRSLGQQLLIARALAQQPHLLVLDETFSTLDLKVVETILSAVRRRGMAVVFVTHRADLAALADRTISLDPSLPSTDLSAIRQAECAP